jgi:hypothetical protein
MWVREPAVQNILLQQLLRQIPSLNHAWTAKGEGQQTEEQKGSCPFTMV